jgi:hydrogenase/urease accessory protein HupE
MKQLLTNNQMNNKKSINHNFKLNHITLFVMMVMSFLSISKTFAHEIRPALLNITEKEPGWFEVMWKVPIFEGEVLDINPIFPEGFKLIGMRSNNAIPGAIIQYFTVQFEGDVMAGREILIERLGSYQIDVLVQLELLDGSRYSAILKPSSPIYTIPEIGSKSEVAYSYWIMGIIHILSGFDHLLFVLALMLIVLDRWKLFKTITAFTVAHSITLALASLGLVNVPPGPTEAVIALSIVFLAGEIINSHNGKFSLTEQYPWVVAMIFGLFHGLGFAGALTDIGLPQNEIPIALLMFNLGVETGQILFLSAALILVAIVKRLKINWPSNSWKWMPYAIGSLAAFWTIERIVGFL